MTEPAQEVEPTEVVEAIVDDDPDEVGTVAVIGERWVEPDKDWPHEWLDFGGDRLAVRKPTLQALAGYSLSASKFITAKTQNDISGLFVARHMSAGTYEHVMDRFMDPDDPDYDEKTVGELMRLIVEMKTSEVAALDNRAQRRGQTS